MSGRRMPSSSSRGSRYTDQWVVDRTLFEYVNQGSCSCCGVSHAMMDTAKFLQLCSDLETDDARKERHCPWPPFMKDELYKDMVGIRAKLKATLPVYQKFVKEELPAFAKWWRGKLSSKERQSLLVMPVEEVKTIYATKLDVRKAYNVLLCALLEQVKKFREIGYPADGRSEAEVDFEDVLESKNGAFVVHPMYVESEEGIESFLYMMRNIGGPRLLPRRRHYKTTASCKNDDEEGELEEGGDADDAGGKKEESETVSFRGDRRLIRVVICRYFFDRIIKRFRQQLATTEAELTMKVENQSNKN